MSNVSPGAPDPGPLITTMENRGSGGEVWTIAVPVTELSLLVAVIMYEPVALFPSVRVVCVRPLLPVVSLVGLSVTFPSLGLTLNVTVSPDVAVPFFRTSTTKFNVSPGAPDPGPLITTREYCGGGGEVVTVAVPLTDCP